MGPVKVKVCGMREEANIRDIAALAPDYLGFIFYPGSKRFVGDSLNVDVLSQLPESISRVGVFVDAAHDEIIDACVRFGLTAVQLHGAESPAFCSALKGTRPELFIFKAIPVSPAGFELDPAGYVGHADGFVFDTASESRGGSGRSFDWSILEAFQSPLPYLLSGGLGTATIAAALERQMALGPLMGFDINSHVEERPGLKSVPLVEAVLQQVRG